MPFNQRVKVGAANEFDRAHAMGLGAPLMTCHVKGYYDSDQSKPYTLTEVPVTFDDMGHPSDLVWKPTEAVVISRLDFVFKGKVFSYVPKPTLVPKGESLHLALHHMQLLDKFGLDALASGRSK